MNNFIWNDFRNLNIPKNIDLNMSIIKYKNNSENNDYVFLEKLEENNDNQIFLIDKLNNEQSICIDFNYYINDVFKSFKKIKDIEKQFRLDIPRCNIYINNHKINCPQIIIDFLNFNFNINITQKIMMLTTQAFLGLPFQFLYNQLHKININYNLAELDSNDTGKLPYRISINISNNDIYFKCYKEFRIFKFDNDTDKTIFKLYLKIEFNINDEDYILMNIKTEKIS
tara:strand:- start:634 stop:1314 length:681 start_codon:yes stop_codon:yes gene_type:complete